MPKVRETGLRTVLFTDVVNSTDLARELGDVRWSRLLAAQRRVIRTLLRTHHGREVDTAGDGFFAVFERPTDAVRCAFDCCRDVQSLGVDIRAGVHFGEVELTGNEVHGIVVHTGARVMSKAGAAEVLVTATVRDLVAGARLEVRERGTFELKGVPGEWTLFDVMSVDDRLRPAPIEEASVASERRDRASSTVPIPARRSRLVAAVALVALVGAAFATVVFTRSEPTFVPTPGTVTAITVDGRFAEPVRLATVPTAIAWGIGRVWVTDRQGQVYWLDPTSGEHGSRGAAGTPTGVAVGGNAVWVTNGFGIGAGPEGGVSRIDSGGDSLDPAFETPVGTESIAWIDERVWVAETDVGQITVYDPVTRTIDRLDLPPTSPTQAAQPDHLAASLGDEHQAWVGDDAAARVFRISARDRVDAFPVPSGVTGIAIDHGVVWVTGGDDDRVTALDVKTGAILTSLEVGGRGCDQPEAVAVGATATWVACRASRTVLRLDPRTRSVTGSLSVGGSPVALAAGDDGSVWLAVGPA
jgi:class 3 adenylate cyclase/streptogramin lyase